MGCSCNVLCYRAQLAGTRASPHGYNPGSSAPALQSNAYQPCPATLCTLPSQARLLHYYAQPAEGSPQQGHQQQQQQQQQGARGEGAAASGADEHSQAWCGWHSDHGSLTGLTSALYLDAHGREVPNPDPSAGLYIRTRHGQVVQAAIPRDCLAYQVGGRGVPCRTVARRHAGGWGEREGMQVREDLGQVAAVVDAGVHGCAWLSHVAYEVCCI